MLKPSKHMAAVLVSFAIIVLLMIIVFLTKQKTLEEKFAVEKLPLVDYNEFRPRKYCYRDLAFTSFAESAYKASERAIESDIKTNGTCPQDLRAPALSSDMAKIEENRMKYLLMSACVNLQYKVIDLNEKNQSNSITIYFNNNQASIDNSTNILYLFLTNPIYIEFEGSDAYIPDYDDISKVTTSSYYTNFNEGLILGNKSNSDIACSFRRLINFGGTGKNATFNYRANGKPVKQLNTLITNKVANTINAKVYFLDNDDLAGTKMSLNNQFVNQRSNNTGVLTIYKKNYNNTVSKNLDEFYFHQNIYKFITNSEYPIFTFRFEISIPSTDYQKLSNKNLEIMKVFMNTNIGKYSSCPLYESMYNNNANILSAIITGYNQINKTFVLTFTTTDNANDATCGPSIIPPRNFDKRTNPSNLHVELPYSVNNERVKVIITVSPYEKITLCKWKTNEKENFIFKRTPLCSTENNFAKVFGQREMQNPAPLQNEDIQLAFSTEYIKDIAYVQLGHMNYLQEYYSKM